MVSLLDRRWLPFALAILLGGGAICLALLAGTSESEQALLAARWTARAGLPIFLVAFLASSLLRLSKNDVTRALMRRRRQWGLGFALAHSIHLCALSVNVLIFAPRDPLSLIGGALAYAMVYVMALTSNDAAMRLLGKWWKRLHLLGIHIIWFIYTLSYAGRLANPDPGYLWTGALLTPVMLGALGLRLYARYRRVTIVAS